MTPSEIDKTAQELLDCATYLPLRREVCETLRASAKLLCILKYALQEECFTEERFEEMMSIGHNEFELQKRRAHLRIVR
jgi:hypothetical protein